MRSLLLAILICVTLASFAQEQPIRAVQPNTVSVSAQGQFEAEPDLALISSTISTSDKSAKAAYDRAAKGVEQVREVLRSAGVDPTAATFGRFTLSPSYEYKGGKRKIVQYVVNTTVQLKLKQFDKVGPILDQLSTVDVTGDQTLNYVVENTETAKAKAVQDAMRRARAEAEAVAKAANRNVGDVLWTAVDTQERIRPVYGSTTVETSSFSLGRAHKAAPPPPPSEGFTPGALTITARVDALFALK